MHTRYFQVGGLAEDVPPGFWDECAKFVEVMPKAVDDYEALVNRNEIWLERTQGIGLLSADDAIALGQSGPVLRGVRRRLGSPRARSRTWPTTRSTSSVPVYHGGRRLRALPRADGGDARVRQDRRAGACAGCRAAPWIADDRKVVLPPREELHTVDGVADPPLQDRHRGLPRARRRGVRRRVESPRGELGCYVVSDGGPKPWRVKFRAPVVRRAGGDGDVHAATRSIADMIAIVGSLDTVMGEVDR